MEEKKKLAWGGRREGAGRPKAQVDRVRVSFYIDECQEVWLKEYTEQFGHTSISAFIREILYRRMTKDSP